MHPTAFTTQLVGFLLTLPYKIHPLLAQTSTLPSTSTHTLSFKHILPEFKNLKSNGRFEVYQCSHNLSDGPCGFCQYCSGTSWSTWACTRTSFWHFFTLCPCCICSHGRYICFSLLDTNILCVFVLVISS